VIETTSPCKRLPMPRIWWVLLATLWGTTGWLDVHPLIKSGSFYRFRKQSTWHVQHGYLVGDFALPLWKMMEWKSVGMIIWLFPIYGKIKHVPNHQPGILGGPSPKAPTGELGANPFRFKLELLTLAEGCHGPTKCNDLDMPRVTPELRATSWQPKLAATFAQKWPLSGRSVWWCLVPWFRTGARTNWDKFWTIECTKHIENPRCTGIR